MPFDRVNPHQIKALNQARKGNLYHKISDSPIYAGMQTRFTAPKPFDCLNISQANAYVVIWYYRPRERKYFILIDVRDFIVETRESDRKSLTEERAKKIASKIIEL